MRVLFSRMLRTRTVWLAAAVVMLVVEVTSLSGPHVCMVKQKYNVTKRVKYRVPVTVKTYEWCYALPPRCTKWSTEMKDRTRLESEERTAEMEDCCPGYKIKDISCIPICPYGKTGAGCTDDCPPNKWGPNCVYDCKPCGQGTCSPLTGECGCHHGWPGESCNTSLPSTPGAMMESVITTTPSTPTKTTIAPTTLVSTPANTFKTPTTDIATTFSTTTKGISTTKAVKTQDVSTTVYSSHENPTAVYKYDDNVSLTTSLPEERSREITIETINRRGSNYNRTETSLETTQGVPNVKVPLENEAAISTKATESTVRTANEFLFTSFTTTEPTRPLSTLTMTTTKETTRVETRKTETTAKQSTTAKFKPKEIWIRPVQKGEHPFETKTYLNVESKAKSKEASTETTTPKTIVVSIIPTSVSYVTFKKFALTTASFISQRRNKSGKSHITTERELTEPTTRPLQTTVQTPITMKILPRKAFSSSTFSSPESNETKISYTTSVSKGNEAAPTSQSKVTNSMNPLLTTNTSNEHVYSSKLTSQNLGNSAGPPAPTASTASKSMKSTLTMAQIVTTKHLSSTKDPATLRRSVPDNLDLTTKEFVEKQAESNSEKPFENSNPNTTAVTKDPMKDEETFHILTEPEHITAVMGNKGNERSSVDLISVISIAGGVMMSIITVAVVIVMIERCKKPRYEKEREYNEIRMQVMADDANDNMPPPPYVRSIFQTPLPDPPTSEKCHYQPISTLDRNLKQFMRPVVVQTISPLMLDNFRGILECHYDHLPRRSQDYETHIRCSISPSIDETSELLPSKRALSLTDSAIEAMKCEATQATLDVDVIDSTTSEPLYAEIPCWRPPSEHAVEIVNLHGEAVTEL